MTPRRTLKPASSTGLWAIDCLTTSFVTCLIDYNLRPQCLDAIRCNLVRDSVCESSHLRLALRGLQTHSQADAQRRPFYAWQLTPATPVD